ncbi:hypothetical protein CS542_06420 [Pedobacter sp. IW39]|nr:hypothetical protein CS542_06420 [Pedobacter sp. IW39]
MLLCGVLTLVSPLSLFAQSKVISGTVTDEQRLPSRCFYPGQRHPQSLHTDSNGKYKIQADGNAEIVFTAIGFTTQTLSAGGNAILNVNLHGTSTGLNEVVVDMVHKRKLM